MDGKIIGYCGTTGIFCLALGAGGIMDLLLVPDMQQAMQHLQYPDYFTRILGTWKILGVIALLVPGQGRLKEWAYAGFVFDLTGAVLSHLAVGDSLGESLPPAVLLGVLVASYLLRPPGRTLHRG